MTESFLENPIFILAVMTAIFVYILYVIVKKFGSSGIKDFKPVSAQDTVYKELKEKVKNQGLKIKKGKILIGVNKIADIRKWIRVKGAFTNYFFDENTKKFVVDEEAKPIPYDLIIFMAKSKNIVFRILGIKNYFFILKHDSILKFDDISNSFILKENIDLIPYADIWINSQDAIEYIHDISIKKMNIELMSALENYPNKIVHLEMAQAKKERLYREMMETDKARYDAIKKAEDTVIS